MDLTTTIIDGMDLEITPTNFTADPLKRTAIGQGIQGMVHFLWASGQRTKMLTLYYEGLKIGQAKKLLVALAPVTKNNRTLELSQGGTLYSIPGKIGIQLSVAEGYCNVTVETIAQTLFV